MISFSKWLAKEELMEGVGNDVYATMTKLGISPGENTPSSMWGYNIYSQEEKSDGMVVVLFTKQIQQLQSEVSKKYKTKLNDKGHLVVYNKPPDGL